MEKQTAQIAKNKCRKNERGAALVTVLMISFLLLVAVTGLLLEASMNTANVTDATAEDQAYYAAESGIQETLNILRVNKIDYFKAVKLCTSNISCDCTSNVCSSSLDTEFRLSRWLPYSSDYPDRVILGSTTDTTQPAYTPQTGFAYKIKVENPDNIGNIIAFNTSGNIGTMGSIWTNGTVTVTYLSKSVSNLDVSTGSAVTDFGSFVIAGVGTISNRVRFAINVNLTTPYSTTKVIRGHIEPGQIPSISSADQIKITYDSESFIVTGSTITLTGGGQIDPPVEDPPGSKVFRVGYVVPLTSPETKINGSITAPEPIRLLIRSTGFAPRGAQKQLEAIILKNYFNGLSAPSPLMLIGPPSTTSPLPSTSFVFNPGTSTGTVYNGKDVHLKAFLPPIGVTNDTNLATVNHELTHGPPNKYNGSIYGTASNVSDELPHWLQSPLNLNTTLKQLETVAKASGRHYPVGSTKPANGDYGNNANATGITYIEGDLEFSQLGGGILVVTGTLTFKGGFNFNGLIIVTGQGGIQRTGGGSGVLQGNMVVAPYLPNDLAKGFLAPVYDISGGGASEIVYNSNNVANGLGALNNFVKGVAEK
jgi:hypothetical protein